jgi:hypothetical protein
MHLCGTCKEFGHGQLECGKQYYINKLKDDIDYTKQLNSIITKENPDWTSNTMKWIHGDNNVFGYTNRYYKYNEYKQQDDNLAYCEVCKHYNSNHKEIKEISKLCKICRGKILNDYDPTELIMCHKCNDYLDISLINSKTNLNLVDIFFKSNLRKNWL